MAPEYLRMSIGCNNLYDFLQETAYRSEALKLMGEAMSSGAQKWQSIANESYIREAGWYFKTLAVQEIGECKS